jgi:hypothetical protein
MARMVCRMLRPPGRSSQSTGVMTTWASASSELARHVLGLGWIGRLQPRRHITQRGRACKSSPMIIMVAWRWLSVYDVGARRLSTRDGRCSHRTARLAILARSRQHHTVSIGAALSAYRPVRLLGWRGWRCRYRDHDSIGRLPVTPAPLRCRAALLPRILTAALGALARGRGDGRALTPPNHRPGSASAR